MSALEVIRLASALIAVRVMTREAVHDVEVIGAGFVFAITVFRKIAGVDRFSTWRSSNSELKKTPKQTTIHLLSDFPPPHPPSKIKIFPRFSADLTVVAAAPLSTGGPACKFAGGSVTALIVAFLYEMQTEKSKFFLN